MTGPALNTDPRDPVAEELHLMKTAGIVEVACRNPNVMEAILHWEARVQKAEAAVAAARAEGLRIGAEVAEAHFQRVHPHSPDDPKGDLVAQGYGNAAINIKLALLAAATVEASK